MLSKSFLKTFIRFYISSIGVPVGQFVRLATCIIEYKLSLFNFLAIFGDPNQESPTIVLPEKNHGVVNLSTAVTIVRS